MSPADPIAFDPPQILNAKRVTGLVVVPEYEKSDLKANPLDLSWNAMAPEHLESGSDPPTLKRRSSLAGNILLVEHPEGQKAFFLQRKMAKTSHGCLRVGFLCEQKIGGMEWNVIKSDGPHPKFEMVTIKIESKDKVLVNDTGKDTFTKDPTVELSALQMIAAYDPRGEGGVIGSSCICADHTHVFSVLPFHGEGTLFQHVVESGRLEERMAQHFFQQILKVGVLFSFCQVINSKLTSCLLFISEK